MVLDMEQIKNIVSVVTGVAKPGGPQDAVAINHCERKAGYLVLGHDLRDE